MASLGEVWLTGTTAESIVGSKGSTDSWESEPGTITINTENPSNAAFQCFQWCHTCGCIIHILSVPNSFHRFSPCWQHYFPYIARIHSSTQVCNSHGAFLHNLLLMPLYQQNERVKMNEVSGYQTRCSPSLPQLLHILMYIILGCNIWYRSSWHDDTAAWGWNRRGGDCKGDGEARIPSGIDTDVVRILALMWSNVYQCKKIIITTFSYIKRH
jgi:hypothetical protein